ncbi:MAG: SurA N-terminal domain-containing protein [Gammaproteobacteria bacterium]|nr:SurA N-terminal domain-containing protein [Gammaproteobacteria bacterium]
MLQKLNERIRGFVAWVVVILISLVFVLFGVDYYLQSRESSENVATVNAQPISTRDFDLRYRRIRQQEMSQGHVDNELLLKQQVLEDLILKTILIEAAHHNGLFISTEEGMAEVVKIPQFQEEGHFSTKRYQQVLANAMYTPTTLLNELMQGMLVNQQRFGFVGSEFGLTSELEQYANSLYEKRDYEYVVLPLSQVKDKIVISAEEMQQYYQQHQQEFIAPLQVQIAYLALSVDDLKPQVQLTDKALQTYYDENKDNFSTPARWKVQHILFAIPQQSSAAAADKVKQRAQQAYDFLNKHPNEFTKWAQTKSDDPISAKKNGELPWMTAGQSELDAVLLTLSKPGDMAKPAQTKNGFELVKLVAFEPSKTKPYTAVSGVIREQLLNEHAQTLYLKEVEKLGELSYQYPETLEPVADALHLTIAHSQPFSQQESKEKLTGLAQVKTAALSPDVLEQGNNSEVVQVDDTHVVVLRVEKKIPSRLLSFDEAKPTIIKQLMATKSKALLEVTGADFMKGQQAPWVKSLTWHQEKAVKRDEETTQPQLRTLAFEMHTIGAMKGAFLADGNYAVVRLKQIVHEPLKSLDHEQTQAVMQQLESTLGLLEYDLYTRALVEKAKVVREKLEG